MSEYGCRCSMPKVEHFVCRNCFALAVGEEDQELYEEVMIDLTDSYGHDDMSYLHDLGVGVVRLIRRHQEPLLDRLRYDVGRLTRERDEWEANEQERYREGRVLQACLDEALAALRDPDASKVDSQVAADDIESALAEATANGGLVSWLADRMRGAV